MSPVALALRTILLGRPRSVLAVLVIAASLCVLDLFAGHIGSVHARLEYEAVVGERLGHLAILRSATAHGGGGAFDLQQARQVKRVAETVPGVALVVPQMSVQGIASTGQRSAMFQGEGISAAVARAAASVPGLPGTLSAARRNGIAVSSGQARFLGLQNGSNLTLTGAAADAPAVPLSAEVVDVFSSAGFGPKARSLLMPFEMAQSLLDTVSTERFVVFLSEPKLLEQRRAELLGKLRNAGLNVVVRTWEEQSESYATQRSAFDLQFDSVAGMAFAAIAAAIAATIAMNALERRREVATLRALGMHSSGVFLMYAAEALWMAAMGIAISLVASGVIAWVVNRAAQSDSQLAVPGGAAILVELDFNRMLMAVLTVLAVALLAALVPAFKAARAGVTESLAA